MQTEEAARVPGRLRGTQALQGNCAGGGDLPVLSRISHAATVRALMTYIDANYAEPITLRDLNRLTPLTIFQIIRAFRRVAGTTPHAYLVTVRIDRAAASLSSGETIARAAAEAGFSDQSHFTRHFKKRYGKTPREFAESAAAG